MTNNHNLKTITIIGGGLGGLTSGALLAQDGHKVTLLEQHNIVGGCATTFKRKGGFSCEVGLHEMEGIFTNPQIKIIFDKLDIYDNVEFVKPDEFFSIVTKNGTYIIPDDLQEAQERLTEKFPQEHKGLKEYFEFISNIPEEYKNRTVTEVLDKIIKNDELKLILNANVQYYNDTPDTLSFLFHSIAQHSYYSGGGWFIKGGSQKLSDHLAKVIKDNSGEIITKANVVACDLGSVSYLRKK